MRALPLVAVVLTACAADQDPAQTRAGGGCLFWSTDCTRLDDPPPAEPLPVDGPSPAPSGMPRAASLPASTALPAEDLGRVRAAHSPRQTDREAEADFNARFTGPGVAPPAETVYPLPSNCSAPPSSLLRNSPGGRFAPAGNTAAGSAYASAYARCGRPGTWPRP